MTREEYSTLLDSQDGKCAICGQAKPLQVDHDHATGKVRGLLCGNCNKMIGLAGDSPQVLVSAASYLT